MSNREEWKKESKESQVRISFAGEEDLPGIYEILRRVEEVLEDASWYFIDDEDFIRSHLQEEGRILKAEVDGKLAGFCILRFPAEDSLEEYLQSETSVRVIHMESMAVAPNYRGRHLQRAMLERGQRWAFAQGFEVCMTTVHPDNEASLRSFFSLGYRIVARTRKYGGLPRYVLYCWKGEETTVER